MKLYDGCVDEKDLPWVDQHQPPQYWEAPRSASAVGLHSLTSSASEHFNHDDGHIHSLLLFGNSRELFFGGFLGCNFLWDFSISLAIVSNELVVGAN